MTTHIKTLQRTPAELHERLKTLAAASGMSVNAIINKACELYVASVDMPTLQQRLEKHEKRIAEIESRIRHWDEKLANAPQRIGTIEEREVAADVDDGNDSDEDDSEEKLPLDQTPPTITPFDFSNDYRTDPPKHTFYNLAVEHMCWVDTGQPVDEDDRNPEYSYPKPIVDDAEWNANMAELKSHWAKEQQKTAE